MNDTPGKTIGLAQRACCRPIRYLLMADVESVGDSLITLRLHRSFSVAFYFNGLLWASMRTKFDRNPE